MNEFNRGFGAVDVRSMDTSVNAGLRTFMLGVYQKLALGIALSGGIAFLVGSDLVLRQLLLGTPLVYLFQFGPLVLILGSAFLMKNPSPLATGILYWAIVVMLGVCLSIWDVLSAQPSSKALCPSSPVVAPIRGLSGCPCCSCG